MKKPTGFALLTPEQRRAMALKGTRAVKNRTFSDKSRALMAAVKGSLTGGFSFMTPEQLKIVGRAGGLASAAKRARKLT